MIIIKDIKMPKTCGDCKCLVVGDGQESICPFSQDAIMDDFVKSKPTWCPLIDLGEQYDVFR